MTPSFPILAFLGLGGGELLAILLITLLFLADTEFPPRPPRNDDAEKPRQRSRRLPFLMPTLFP